MKRTWVDPRDDEEWEVEAIYVMPEQEPGAPIAMMGPDVPQRIRFTTGSAEHSLIAKLQDPLPELPDAPMMALLDAAKETR